MLADSQKIYRYIRRDYSKNLEITSSGIALYNSCISHCLKHAFGSCDLPHMQTCKNCESLLLFLKKLKEYLPSECHEMLNDYKKNWLHG